MEEIDVRIVEFGPALVASAMGYGESPEPIAWDKLLTWAREKGLLKENGKSLFYGFNNPDPSVGTPNYGYEQWMTVPAGTAPGDGITIKEFSGGLYAVARCESLEVIGERWKQLVAWREDSEYHQAYHQWLEQLLTPPNSEYQEYVFDLFLPIAK